MNRKGKNGIIVAEDVGSAVAVMDVGVDDDGFFYCGVRLQTSNGYRDVVYRAEAFAVIGVGVVKPASEITGEAIAECELSGEDGAAGGEPDGLGEFG